MPYLWSKLYLLVFTVGILGNLWKLRWDFDVATNLSEREKSRWGRSDGHRGLEKK